MKLIYALAELFRDLKELIIWMKSNEYPTCRNCRYWSKNGPEGGYNEILPACGRVPPLATVWYADEYCSKWEEEVK